jgi:mannose-6-phosphate isomerase-like protein (cupin superfamily)
MASDSVSVSIVIRQLAGGPTPPDQGPSALHTRVADVVNRPHWHREFDEWWVVLGGRLEWELTGGVVVQATKDDIVWVPRGTVHHIRNVGEELSLRLAVAMPPAMHYFSPCEQCGYTDDGPSEWCA